MAVPVSDSGAVFGILLWDAIPNPTKMYIYARGTSRAEMAVLIGKKKKDGTFVEGAFSKNFNAGTFAAGNDSIDMGQSTHVVEEDTDGDSPHRGEVRLSVALSATA